MPLDIFDGPSKKLSGRGKAKKLRLIKPDLDGSESDVSADETASLDTQDIDLSKPYENREDTNRVSVRHIPCSPHTDKSKWCCCCGNGGTMLACGFCPRSVCYNHCVKLAIPEKQLKRSDTYFLCPACHKRWDRTEEHKKGTPYIVCFALLS
jgi:hypothetical protein